MFEQFGSIWWLRCTGSSFAADLQWERTSRHDPASLLRPVLLPDIEIFVTRLSCLLMLGGFNQYSSLLASNSSTVRWSQVIHFTCRFGSMPCARQAFFSSAVCGCWDLCRRSASRYPGGCNGPQLNTPFTSSHLGNAGTFVAESVQVLDDVGVYPSSETARRHLPGPAISPRAFFLFWGITMSSPVFSYLLG